MGMCGICGVREEAGSMPQFGEVAWVGRDWAGTSRKAGLGEGQVQLNPLALLGSLILH
jgi:hypothetical protein